VGLAACNQPIAPTPVAGPASSSAPSATGAPPIPAGSYSLTGIITERSAPGDHPLGDANVNAWIQTGSFGYSYMWANGPRLSDSQGRYTLTNLPSGATFQFQVYKQGYVQQCAAPELVVNGDLHLDAQLIARANVSASPESVPPSLSGFRVIAGVLYEITAEGRRPASGAFVDYEPTEDSPAATTYTDPQGRFLLCGIPQTRTATIGAALGVGHVAYRSVPPGPDASIEIEIK